MHLKFGQIKYILATLFLTSSAAFGSEEVICVQKQLNALGYAAGVEDGKLGRDTKNASIAYLEFMRNREDGWNKPNLTRKNANFWCKQLASAWPKASKFYSEMLDAKGASSVHLRNVKVNRNVKAGEPYKVDLFYAIDGSHPVEITKACFMWNNEGPYCFDANINSSNKTASLFLTTGNPKTYYLNGALEYKSGGETLMTNFYTNEIVVSK